MRRPFDVEKLERLRELADIPSNCGEQFINVWLNLCWLESGHVSFGFNWKCDMGEQDFHTLDEAIQIVTELRKKAVPAS